MNFNPDDWFDLIAYLIVGIPAIIAAVGAIAARKALEKSHNSQTATADAVLDQVKNDHATNLRDDIDALGSQIKLGFKEIHTDISGLRSELRTERVERIEGDRRHSDYT